MSITTYTTAGSHTYTAEGDGTVVVELWGGGGGGSGTDGSGGGGGAYTKKNSYTVTNGSNYTAFVGAGGIGGGDSGGANGTDSYWINSSTVLAKGGSASPDISAAGGAAGSGIGDVKYSGGAGGETGGSGGSSAGTGSTGTSAESASDTQTNGPTGSGYGGAGDPSGFGVGVPGGAPGGGGGGGYPVGGDGAVGKIIITFTAGGGGTSVSRAEQANLTDSSTRAATETRSGAEQANLTDSSTRAATETRSGAEQANLTDASTRTTDFAVSIAEQSNLTDSSTQSSGLQLVIAEQTNATDSSTQAASIPNTAAEQSNATDSSTQAAGIPATGSEQANLTDTPTQAATIPTVGAEQANLTDSTSQSGLSASINTIWKGSALSGTSVTSDSHALTTGQALIAFVFNDGGSPTAPSGVKWGGSGGTAMTQVPTTSPISFADSYMSVWTITNGTAQNSTVYASWASSQDAMGVIAVSIDNANLSSLIASIVSATALNSVGPAAVTLTGVTAGQLILALVGVENAAASGVTFQGLSSPLAAIASIVTLGTPGFSDNYEGMEIASGIATSTSHALTAAFQNSSAPSSMDWGIFALAINTATGGSSYNATGTEQSNLTDAQTQAASIPKTAAEQANLTDAATQAASIPATGSEQSNLTDSSTQAASIPAASTEQANLTDASTESAGSGTTVSEQVNATDSGTQAASIPASGAEQANLTNSQTQAAVFPVTGFEQSNLTDASSQTTGSGNSNIFEGSNVSDLVGLPARVSTIWKGSQVTALSALSTDSQALVSGQGLLAFVFSDASVPPVVPSAVKWGGVNGQAMVQVGTGILFADSYISLWKLSSGAAQTSTIYASWAATQDASGITGVAIDGGDLSALTITSTTALNTLGPTSTVLSGLTEGELILHFTGIENANGSGVTIQGVSAPLAPLASILTLGTPNFADNYEGIALASGYATATSHTLTQAFQNNVTPSHMDVGVIALGIPGITTFAYNATDTEQTNATDSSTQSPAFAKSDPEGANTTDTQSNATGLYGIGAEQANLTDSQTQTQAFAKSLPESANVTDTQTAAGIFVYLTVEGVNLADFQSLPGSLFGVGLFGPGLFGPGLFAGFGDSFSFNAGIVESAGLTDGRALSVQLASAGNEGSINADSPTQQIVGAPSVAESINTTDAENPLPIFSALTTESASLTDTDLVGALLALTITEALNATDGVTVTALSVNAVTEGMSANDVQSGTGNLFFVNIPEGTSVLDAMTGAVETILTTLEGVRTFDVGAISSDITVVIPEGSYLTDEGDVHFPFLLSQDEASNFTDIVNWVTGKPIHHKIKIKVRLKHPHGKVELSKVMRKKI